MKFRDKCIRRGSRFAPALIALILTALACSLPLTAPPGELPTPEGITWLTNTPGPVTTILETPGPSEEIEELPTATLPPTVTPPEDAVVIDNTPYLYNAQGGDSIYSLAIRFSVLPG